MLIDLHMHTYYSSDAAPDPVRAHCLAAAEKGISILGIADHIDYYRQKPTEGLDVSKRQKEIAACKQEFADKVEVLCSIELGQPYQNPKESRELMENGQFDYIIGSLHAMPNDIDMYFLPYAEMDCGEFLQEYFDELEKLLHFGGFQILAHLDYPLRVMKLPGNTPSFSGYMDRVETVLKLVIEKGIALEVNAKGLFGWQKEVGPELFVLNRYRQLGGELITAGSDSHASSSIGLGLSECIARIKEAGFSSVTCFKEKKPYQIKL